MSHEPTPPTLEPLLRAELDVAPPQALTPGPLGQRRIMTITGGRFHGERLNGTVLPGGGDWLLERHDHATQLDARYTLETDDGALIYVQDRGLRHGPELTMARLRRGEPVNPADYYFRTSATFETGAARYAWLNAMLIVGSGMRHGTTVTLDFYVVR